MSNLHKAKQQRAPLPESTPELAERKEVMRATKSDPALKHAAEAEGQLRCYLRGSAKAAIEAGEGCDVEALAASAVDYGCPELAEAAAMFLASHYRSARSGEVRPGQAQVGAIEWGDDDEPGRGILRLAGLDWEMLD